MWSIKYWVFIYLIILMLCPSAISQHSNDGNNIKQVTTQDKRTVSLTTKANTLYNILSIYLNQINHLKKQGEYEKALVLMERFNRLKDSLHKFRLPIKTSVINSKYKKLKNEIELKLNLEKLNEMRQQTMHFRFSYLLLLLLLLLFFGQKIRHKKRNKIITEHTLTLKSKHVLSYKDIYFIKSDGHYLDFHVRYLKKPITERNQLKARLKDAEQNGFKQVHRSYIINLKKIKAIYAQTILLENDVEIPLSRSFKLKLKKEKVPPFI